MRNSQSSGENVCIRCSKEIDGEDQFVWTDCDHEYCKQCVINIINTSLSLFNQIPKCIYSECNALLSNQHAQQLNDKLLAKYTIKKSANNNNTTLLEEHKKNHLLVYGYIRKTNKNVPNEVILFMLDYYHLIYHTKVACFPCKSTGYRLSDCKTCQRMGYTVNYDKYTYKEQVKLCKKCNGKGQTTSCNNCDGIANQELITLDFNKLCHKQSFCIKCNQYFPNDMIIYCSNCHHAFCESCISQHTSLCCNGSIDANIYSNDQYVLFPPYTVNEQLIYYHINNRNYDITQHNNIPSTINTIFADCHRNYDINSNTSDSSKIAKDPEAEYEYHSNLCRTTKSKIANFK